MLLRAPSPEVRHQQPTLPVKWLILKPGQRIDIVPDFKDLQDSVLHPACMPPCPYIPNQTMQLLMRNLWAGELYLCFNSQFSRGKETFPIVPSEVTQTLLPFF